MKKNNQPNKDEVKKQDNKKDDKKGAIPEVVAVSLPSLEEMEKQKKKSQAPKLIFNEFLDLMMILIGPMKMKPAGMQTTRRISNKWRLILDAGLSHHVILVCCKKC